MLKVKIENPDVRSLIAVNLAEAYAHGRCTVDGLSAARQGAYATAYADADADADAAAYTARRQERDAQVVELIKLIKEEV